jgi:hypothetical protein
MAQEKLYPTYKVALVKFAEDKNTILYVFALYVDCSSRASASVHAVQNVAPSPFDQYNAVFSPLTTVLSMSTCRIFWVVSGTGINENRLLTDPLPNVKV